MKENSKEKDIKIVEKLIKTIKEDRDEFKDGETKEIYDFFYNAMDNILSDYKRVLKENEELKRNYKILKDDIEDERIVYIDTPEFEQRYIPVQKVKDKIEEYKRDVLNLDTYPNFSEQEMHREIVDALQELIESED